MREEWDQVRAHRAALQNPATTLEEVEQIESKTVGMLISSRESLTDLINERKKELGYKRYGIIWRELKEPKTVKRAEAAAKRKREEAKKRKEINESLGKAFRERRKQKEQDDRDRKLKEYMKKIPKKEEGAYLTIPKKRSNEKKRLKIKSVVKNLRLKNVQPKKKLNAKMRLKKPSAKKRKERTTMHLMMPMIS